jgi:phosphoribosylformylglycinamidine synthase I
MSGRAAAPEVAVIQFPGSNCEAETLRAVRAVGLGGRIHRWNQSPDQLSKADAVILPGGFSFQDRVRAGVLAAKLPLMAVVEEMAAAGKPVLGICNGAQILVEAGLLPGGEGGAVRMALAPNRMRGRTGYYSRWVYLAVREEAHRCIFTQSLKPGEALPIPMAHGEGRYAQLGRSDFRGNVPLAYAAATEGAAGFPWNPNGSLEDAAAVMNASGNVMGMMPHPERALRLRHVPPGAAGAWGRRRRGAFPPDEPGPGWGIFLSLAESLGAAGP